MSEDEGYETVDRQSSGDDLAKTSGTVSIIKHKNHPNELLLQAEQDNIGGDLCGDFRFITGTLDRIGALKSTTQVQR